MTDTKHKIGFIGLGAMGYGMATHLQRSGFPVVGFDVDKPAVARLVANGGEGASSPRDAASRPDIKTLICMVATSKQATSVLFDEETGAVNVLPQNATILLCITASPTYVVELRARLDQEGRADIGLVDCPVSGGANRAADGTLSLLASAEEFTMTVTRPVLECLGANLHIIPGGIGGGSMIKLAHQILVGVHIGIANEVIGLAMLARLDVREVHAAVMEGEGASWLFDQRVPHMTALDKPPYSSLAIITKDMAMVTAYGRARRQPLPLSATVEQIFISTISAGWGEEDDCAVLRLYLLGRLEISELSKPKTCKETPPGPDSGISIETIRDLLVGVQLVAAREALSFAASLGIDIRLMGEIVKDAAGSSAMFRLACANMQERGSCSLNVVQDVKRIRRNLELAVEAASRVRYPLYLSSAALQQYYLEKV